MTWQCNPFGYAGQYTDTETGLQYLRARYYDPSTGVFLSRDPLEAQTKEPYAYASNDPLNGTDPTGLSRCGQFSLGGLVDCASKARAPDYLTVDVSACGAFGFHVIANCKGVVLTLSRSGDVYFGGQGGTGITGFSPAARFGWLNQGDTPCEGQLDSFISGHGVTASGNVPLWGPLGPAAGEAYGFGGTSTELGAAVGLPGAQVTYQNQQKIFRLPAILRPWTW